MAQNYGGWLGILKWSLAQSDGTEPSDFGEMSAEVGDGARRGTLPSTCPSPPAGAAALQTCRAVPPLPSPHAQHPTHT